MGRNQILEKAIHVNQELCAGCVSCIDACSAGAIHLVDDVAEIDETLCIACEACLDACPNGAITAITEPASPEPIMIQPVTDRGLEIDKHLTTLPGTSVPNRSLKSLAGATLSFWGSAVAPRMVDVLIKSIENRLAQPTTTSISSSIPSSRGYGLQSIGQRRQIRLRGGNQLSHPGARSRSGR